MRTIPTETMRIRLPFIALLLAYSVSAFAQSSADFVFVTGSAKVQSKPEVGIIEANLVIRRPTERAIETLRALSAALILEAQKIGVAQDQLDASEIGKGIKHNGNEQMPVLTRKLTFRIKNLEKLPAFFDRLTSTKNVEDLSVNFEVNDEKALEVRLLAAAAEDAMSRAKMLAGITGRKLGQVIAISEDPLYSVDLRFGGFGLPDSSNVSFVAAPDSERISRIPSSLSYSKRVHAKFKLD
jgi:uncharacterized protein YggE